MEKEEQQEPVETLRDRMVMAALPALLSSDSIQSATYTRPLKKSYEEAVSAKNTYE